MSSLLPEPELRAEYSRRRTRQWLVTLPAIAAVLAVRWLDNARRMPFGLSQTTVVWAAVAIAFGVAIFSFINWRCPSCNKYLGRGFNPKYCRGCGFLLRE